MSREELVQEFCDMCREEGAEPNEAKIRKTFERYSVAEIERLLDACARFGVQAIMNYKS